MNYIQVTTTVATFEDAENIARSVVTERLAACVHLTTCHSVYRWEDKVHDDNEHLLTIKSRTDLWPGLRDHIRRLHTYDVPELLVTPVINGSREYLQWLEGELLPPEA